MKRLIASSTMLLSMIVISLLSQIAPTRALADEGDSQRLQQNNGDVVRGYLWNDNNCDGLRQTEEGPLPFDPLVYREINLFFIGNDNVPFTRDDSIVALTGLNRTISYSFINGGGGYSYYIAMRPSQRPVGFVPSRYQVGEDRSIDNDMTVWPDGAWATSTFVIPNATGFPGGPGAVTGIDIGLCPVANLNLPYKMALPLVLR